MFQLRDEPALRHALYRKMLALLDAEHKFAVQADVVQGVLAAFAERALPVDGPAAGVLADALAVLAMPELALARPADSAENDVPIDEREGKRVCDCKSARLFSVHALTPCVFGALAGAEAQLADARDRLMTRVVKRNVVENVVPIVIELKRELERRHSPLLRNLMLYLQHLFAQHEGEVNEVLQTCSDRRLAKELACKAPRLAPPLLALTQHASFSLALALSLWPDDVKQFGDAESAAARAAMPPPPPSARARPSPVADSALHCTPHARAPHTPLTRTTPASLRRTPPTSAAPKLRSASSPLTMARLSASAPARHASARAAAATSADIDEDEDECGPSVLHVASPPADAAPPTPWRVRARDHSSDAEADAELAPSFEAAPDPVLKLRFDEPTAPGAENDASLANSSDGYRSDKGAVPPTNKQSRVTRRSKRSRAAMAQK